MAKPQIVYLFIWVLLGGCYGVPDGRYGVSRSFQYDPVWLQGCSQSGAKQTQLGARVLLSGCY